MSGYYTKTIYDPLAYQESLKQSTGPLNYRLDANQAINCQQCFAPNGPRGMDAATARGEEVDIDSVLRGVNKINSKSSYQQQPSSLAHYKPIPLPTCPRNLDTQYTRLTDPAYQVKGVAPSDLRFSYPLWDPQCHIGNNFSVDTRLQAKDNHAASSSCSMSCHCRTNLAV